jgi:hypothetical protein
VEYLRYIIGVVATGTIFDMDNCAVCDTNRNLDLHHLVSRGMGGSKDLAVHGESNLITLCRTCHRNIHEGGWELHRSRDLLQVVDRRTRKEVMRRARAEDFDPSALFQLLNVMDRSLVDALSLVAYLDDDQLLELFRASRSLGRRAWMLQAAVLHEAQRRSVYGARSLEAIARRFEINARQAEKYALVWRLFFASEGPDVSDSQAKRENVNVDVFSLEEPSWYIVAATESPEPHRWLAYAQDRKAEDPRYSIGVFRSEIQQAIGGSATVIERHPTNPTAFAGRIVWDCPWVKPYCRRSGRPVPADECPCERDGDISAGAQG